MITGEAVLSGEFGVGTKRMTLARWRVLAVLFFISVINFIDQAMISIAGQDNSLCGARAPSLMRNRVILEHNAGRACIGVENSRSMEKTDHV